jgi:hypothetical protein
LPRISGACVRHVAAQNDREWLVVAEDVRRLPEKLGAMARVLTADEKSRLFSMAPM